MRSWVTKCDRCSTECVQKHPVSTSEVMEATVIDVEIIFFGTKQLCKPCIEKFRSLVRDFLTCDADCGKIES